MELFFDKIKLSKKLLTSRRFLRVILVLKLQLVPIGTGIHRTRRSIFIMVVVDRIPFPAISTTQSLSVYTYAVVVAPKTKRATAAALKCTILMYYILLMFGNRGFAVSVVLV